MDKMMDVFVGFVSDSILQRHNSLRLSAEGFKQLKACFEEMEEVCIATLIKSESLEELEENIKQLLPLFSIYRFKLGKILLKELSFEEILTWVKSSLEFSKKTFIQKLKKVLRKEIVEEKIRLFFALSKSILEKMETISAENSNPIVLLKLFSMETNVLLPLYSLLKIENESVKLEIREKLAMQFCDSVRKYRILVESTFRQYDLNQNRSFKQKRLVVKQEDLKTCPLPPEPEWNEEWVGDK